MSDATTMRYRWTCPHCGLEQLAAATMRGPWGNAEMQVIRCDPDEGGCDEMVALQPMIRVETTVYKLVEAEEEPAQQQGIENDAGSREDYLAIRKQHQEWLDARRSEPPSPLDNF